MFGLILFVVFAIYGYTSYKKGLMPKNRFIGSMVMMFIGFFFIPFLVPVLGLFPVLILCFVNAFWTPSVITNFLDDMQKKP